MALVVRSTVAFQVNDGTIGNFVSGNINNQTTNFSQNFGADILVPANQAEEPVSLQGVGVAQQVFFMADQPLQLKLIPVGGTAVGTLPLILYPNLPSLISVQNISAITIANPTNVQAKLIIEGVGVAST